METSSKLALFFNTSLGILCMIYLPALLQLFFGNNGPETHGQIPWKDVQLKGSLFFISSALKNMAPGFPLKYQMLWLTGVRSIEACLFFWATPYNPTALHKDWESIFLGHIYGLMLLISIPAPELKFAQYPWCTCPSIFAFCAGTSETVIVGDVAMVIVGPVAISTGQIPIVNEIRTEWLFLECLHFVVNIVVVIWSLATNLEDFDDRLIGFDPITPTILLSIQCLTFCVPFHGLLQGKQKQMAWFADRFAALRFLAALRIMALPSALLQDYYWVAWVILLIVLVVFSTITANKVTTGFDLAASPARVA